jgi:membrane-associated phospholipid phosphatase
MLGSMPDVAAQFPLGHWFFIIFLFLVAFARVFFMCHYVGDTLAGIILGYLVYKSNVMLTNLIV